MSRTSRESVCQRYRELRGRLERLKKSWTAEGKENAPAASFHKDWHAGWLRIVAGLRELDQALNHCRSTECWNGEHPAILQFPPAKDGILSMGPF